jgi:hypothetical protein
VISVGLGFAVAQYRESRMNRELVARVLKGLRQYLPAIRAAANAETGAAASIPPVARDAPHHFAASALRLASIMRGLRSDQNRGVNMEYDDARQEPTSHLIHNVIDDVRELFRQEVALARAEVRDELGAWTTAAAGTAAGGAIAAVGGLFVLVAIAQGAVALFGWPNWAGFLLVGVVLAIAGFVAVQAGRKRVAKIVALPMTKETVRETSTWIKDRMTSQPQ